MDFDTIFIGGGPMGAATAYGLPGEIVAFCAEKFDVQNSAAA